MVSDEDVKAAADLGMRVIAAREAVKEYARAELGIDIGPMDRSEAIILVLAHLIEKQRKSGQIEVRLK